MNRVLAEAPTITTDQREIWRLAPGSHLAVAPDRQHVPIPAHLAAGTLSIDPATSVGSLTLAFVVDGRLGQLRGVAQRDDAADGSSVWTVRGSLDLGRTTPVTLTLRDHGAVHVHHTWWWLSGTGDEQPCQRRRRAGSRVVADLLFAPVK